MSLSAASLDTPAIFMTPELHGQSSKDVESDRGKLCSGTIQDCFLFGIGMENLSFCRIRGLLASASGSTAFCGH